MRTVILTFALILLMVPICYAQDGSIAAWGNPGSGRCDVPSLNAGISIGVAQSSEVALTNSPAWDGKPDWSPDGSKIVFISTRDGSAHLWVMSATGEPPASQLTAGPGREEEPAWAPDGSQIAFAHYEEGGTEGWGVWVISADGGVAVQLTNELGGGDPTWSPDGSTIAFISHRSGNWDIWSMPSNGEIINPGSAIQLTNDPADDGDPSWSPDGDHIAFMSDRSGRDIWVIPASGEVVNPGSAVNLTNHPALDQHPAWSPDGSSIAFQSNRSDVGFDIWTIPSTGGPPITQITTFAGSDQEPAWSPDGERIVFESLRSGPEGNMDVWATTLNWNEWRACCAPATGACTMASQANCAAPNLWLADWTACSPNPCPQPGACCTSTGSCTVTSEWECSAPRIWQGTTTVCDPNPCAMGACCLYVVCEIHTPADCAARGGIYEGNGHLCQPDPCPTSSIEGGSRGAMSLSLHAAPNPTTGDLTIEYQLPQASTVVIEIFSAGGALVRRIEEGHRQAGVHRVPWDGRDAAGRALSSGVYLSKIRAGAEMTSCRVVLAR